MSKHKLLVLGVGNPLRGDDGFGAAVVQALAEEPLPEGVVVDDGGTPGPGLIATLEEAEEVLILDAADMGKPPGTLVEFTPSEVRDRSSRSGLTIHEADLFGTLHLMMELGNCPTIRILAVQPARTTLAPGLSVEVYSAIPEAIEKVRQAIARVSP